jgi:hypothetical protein
MNSVKVHKAELLEKVKRNRDAHRDLFLKAQEGYRTAVIAELDRMLADAKAANQSEGLSPCLSPSITRLTMTGLSQCWK